MLKIFQSFIAIFLFILCPLYGDIHTAPILKEDPQGSAITQGVVIPIPDAELQQKWTLAYKEIVPGGAWIMEWIPKGEDINNWTQLIQVQYFPFSQISTPTKITASDFSTFFIQTLRDKFPDIKSNLTVRNPDNVLIEWSLPKPTQGESSQHELAEAISTDDGLYRIAYTKKVPVMDRDERLLWTDRLSKVKVEEAPVKDAPVNKLEEAPAKEEEAPVKSGQ